MKLWNFRWVVFLRKHHGRVHHAAPMLMEFYGRWALNGETINIEYPPVTYQYEIMVISEKKLVLRSHQNNKMKKYARIEP
ncbi:MAG TPA: hypothetical protein VF268_14875 [Gammaproteobacteria bacterium]